MSLNSKAIPSGSDVYYTESFRNALAAHIPYILNGNFEVSSVESKLDVRYRYDFNGLMQELQIHKKLWWITMRINGFHRPDEYTGGLTQILKPKEAVIDSLLASHLAMK